MIFTIKRICAIVLAKVKSLVDIRDVHVYGGIAILSAGLAVYDWRIALIVAGSLIFYLGQRRT